MGASLVNHRVCLWVCSHCVQSSLLCVYVLDWVDYVMLALYIVYQVCFFIFPLRTILHHELPTASAVVVVSEQVAHSAIYFSLLFVVL